MAYYSHTPKFGRLVLGCIEAEFCNLRSTYQHFQDLQDLFTSAAQALSSSDSIICTARISNF